MGVCGGFAPSLGICAGDYESLLKLRYGGVSGSASFSAVALIVSVFAGRSENSGTCINIIDQAYSNYLYRARGYSVATYIISLPGYHADILGVRTPDIPLLASGSAS